MKNADMPINPLVNDNGHPHHASQIAFGNKPLVSGLTKREHAAIEAMKGMLSSAPYWDMDFDTVVIAAVEQADRLFNALEEQK